MGKTFLSDFSENLTNLRNPILVFGARGMLGSEFMDRLSPKFPSSDLIGMDLEEADITDLSVLRPCFQRIKPKLVINTAAYTNVDGAETEKDLSFQCNVTGPECLASTCQEFGAFLVHFSTDHVFDGLQRTAKKETDHTNPVNQYAYTKRLGEQKVLQYADSLVVRVQWLYGLKKDRFTTLKDRDVFTPFCDQWGAPTWTRDVVNATLALLDKNVRGLFHFAYDDHATWADVFSYVKSELNLSVQLIPKKTEEVSLPAKRPSYSVMSNQKFLDTLGYETMGSWKNSLKEFLSIAATKL